MLTDKMYEYIKPFLPQKRRPGMSHRDFLEAILYVLSTGYQWRKLPSEYGNWHTIYTRFKRWSEKGIMQKIVGSFIEQGLAGCSIIIIDSTVVRAHHCASGAQKKNGLKVLENQKADSQRRFMQYLLMKQP